MDACSPTLTHICMSMCGVCVRVWVCVSIYLLFISAYVVCLRALFGLVCPLSLSNKLYSSLHLEYYICIPVFALFPVLVCFSTYIHVWFQSMKVALICFLILLLLPTILIMCTYVHQTPNQIKHLYNVEFRNIIEM